MIIIFHDYRIKLGFYQRQDEIPVSVKPLTNNPENGLLIRMTKNQLEFLTEKYLESVDFESETSSEILPDGNMTSNEREAIEAQEVQYPGTILTNMLCFSIFCTRLKTDLLKIADTAKMTLKIL